MLNIALFVPLDFALPDNKTPGSGLTIIVGPNNSGKTTIIESMRYITVAFLFLLTLCSPIMIMSSDYVDSLELGFDPPENSQYWVAPFIEEFFKNNLNLIDRSCLDYLRENTSMEFEI